MDNQAVVITYPDNMKSKISKWAYEVNIKCELGCRHRCW